MDIKDPYTVLDLPRSATPEQLSRRYKQLVRIYHPDRVTGSTDKAYAEERLKLINQAYAAVAAAHKPSAAPQCEQSAPGCTTQNQPSAPLAALRPTALTVWLGRQAQPILIAGGILLAGLTTTPLLAYHAHMVDWLWPTPVVERLQLESLTSVQNASAESALTDWVPVVSPSGQQMAFIWQQAGQTNLYVRHRQSGRLHEVAHNLLDSTVLVWSPDETKLAFIANEAGKDLLYVLDLQTAQVEPIAEAAHGSQLGQLPWSTEPITVH